MSVLETQIAIIKNNDKKLKSLQVKADRVMETLKEGVEERAKKLFVTFKPKRRIKFTSSQI